MTDTATARSAESVGSALGKVAARVDSWLAQRDEIARELSSVIERAQDMLSSLGHGKALQRQAANPPSEVRKTATKRRRRTMSKEARERIAAAQKARWAKIKNVKG